MHIAQASLQFGATSTGGGGIHVEKVAEYLRRTGHQVTVLSIHTNKTLAAGPTFHPDGHWSQENLEGLTIVRFLIEEGLENPYAGDKHTELMRIPITSRALRHHGYGGRCARAAGGDQRLTRTGLYPAKSPARGIRLGNGD